MPHERVMLGESEFKWKWLFMLARGLEGGGRECPSARIAVVNSKEGSKAQGLTIALGCIKSGETTGSSENRREAAGSNQKRREATGIECLHLS